MRKHLQTLLLAVFFGLAIVPSNSFAGNTTPLKVAADSLRNITFKVDLGAEVVTGSVWVTGSFNSWALGAAGVMTRGNDNIYSITLPITQAVGSTILYKYVYNGWPKQETLANSLPCCSATGPRFFKHPKQDTILGLVCYNKCTACDSVKVTFRTEQVNGLTASPNGVHITGDFQQWGPTTSEMTLESGTTYKFEKYFSKGEYLQYKFLNGNTWGSPSEELVLGPCSFNPQSSPNRWLLVPQHDTVISVAYCSCGNTVPQAGTRFAFVGSSGTFGTASARPSYMSVPAQFNKLMGPNSGLVVANFSRPGAAMQRQVSGAGISSYWNSSDFKNVQKFRPEIVLCNLGGNDVKNTFFKTTVYEKDYKDMLDSFRTYSPQVEIWIGTGFRSIVSTEQLCIDSLMPKQQELSTKWGLPYYDFWHPSFNPQFTFTADSLHPDSIGYAVLAQYIYNLWNTPKPTVSHVGDSLKAPAGYVTYWWYKNGNLISPMAGSTGNAVLASGEGKYKVLVRLDPVFFSRLISSELLITATNPALKKTQGKIYPNPAKGKLNIEYQNLTGTETTFTVFDALGKSVITQTSFSKNGLKNLEINIEKLKPGMYMVVGRGNGVLFESRFVKEN